MTKFLRYRNRAQHQVADYLRNRQDRDAVDGRRSLHYNTRYTLRQCKTLLLCWTYFGGGAIFEVASLDKARKEMRRIGREATKVFRVCRKDKKNRVMIGEFDRLTESVAFW